MITNSHGCALHALLIKGVTFYIVPERKILPNRFAKAKIPSLYSVGYRSRNDCINKIMT